MTNTYVVKVIRKLEFVSRLKIVSETGPKDLSEVLKSIKHAVHHGFVSLPDQWLEGLIVVCIGSFSLVILIIIFAVFYRLRKLNESRALSEPAPTRYRPSRTNRRDNSPEDAEEALSLEEEWGRHYREIAALIRSSRRTGRRRPRLIISVDNPGPGTSTWDEFCCERDAGSDVNSDVGGLNGHSGPERSGGSDCSPGLEQNAADAYSHSCDPGYGANQRLDPSPVMEDVQSNVPCSSPSEVQCSMQQMPTPEIQTMDGDDDLCRTDHRRSNHDREDSTTSVAALTRSWSLNLGPNSSFPFKQNSHANAVTSDLCTRCRRSHSFSIDRTGLTWTGPRRVSNMAGCVNRAFLDSPVATDTESSSSANSSLSSTSSISFGNGTTTSPKGNQDNLDRNVTTSPKGVRDTFPENQQIKVPQRAPEDTRADVSNARDCCCHGSTRETSQCALSSGVASSESNGYFLCSTKL